MNLMEIISNSFKYPGSNPEHLNTNRKRWLLFGLMMFAGYLLIPVIFIAGYTLRATRKTIQGDSEMPEFNYWWEMFVDGLKIIVTTFVYYLIPSIIIFLGVGSFYMTLYMENVINTALINIPLLIIGIILFIFAIMLYFVAVSNLAYHGNLAAAFDLKQIFQRIKRIGHGKFAVWWIATMIITFIFAALGEFVNMSSGLLGFFLVPLLFDSFIALFQARSGGLIYRESLNSSEEGGDVETESNM
jgi:hypothetical protein